MVLVPTMPLIVSVLGLSGEVVTLIHYNNNGYQQEFIRTLVLMVIPVVVLLIATITGYEKPKDNDPELVKSSYFIRAFYYAFHVKMFHVYLATVGNAISRLGSTISDENPCKNHYEATIIRRYLAYLGLAPQFVNQMNILLSRVILQGGNITPEENAIKFAAACLGLSLGCFLAMHHVTDKVVDFELHWTVPTRLFGTLIIYIWKLLLVAGRGVACALFIHHFGALVAIPVLLHGIIVFIIFVTCAKPVINGFFGFLKVLIICYCQMYDINDVYLNEVAGKRIVQILYYILRFIADLSLIVPFFVLSTAPESIKLTGTFIVFGTYAGALLVRAFYYQTVHPK